MNSERCFLNPSQNDSVLPSRPFAKEMTNVGPLFSEGERHNCHLLPGQVTLQQSQVFISSCSDRNMTAGGTR